MAIARKEIWCLTHSSGHEHKIRHSTWKDHYRRIPVTISTSQDWSVGTDEVYCHQCGTQLSVAVFGRWLSFLVKVIPLLFLITAIVFYGWAMFIVRQESLCLMVGAGFTAVFGFLVFRQSRRYFWKGDQVDLICFRKGNWGSHRLLGVREP